MTQKHVAKFSIEIDLPYGEYHTTDREEQMEVVDLFDIVSCIGKPVRHSMDTIDKNNCAVKIIVDRNWFKNLRNLVTNNVEIKINKESTKSKSTMHVEGLSSCQFLE